MSGRQVEIVAGEHLVATVHGATVVVAHRASEPLTASSPAVKTWGSLRGLIVAARAEDGDGFGRALVRLVRFWSAERSPDVEFGVLAPVSDGFAVILRGGVAVALDGDGGPETLEGTVPAGTPVAEIRPAPGKAAIYVVDDDGEMPPIPSERGIGSMVDGVGEGAGAVVWAVDIEPPPDLGPAPAQPTPNVSEADVAPAQEPASEPLPVASGIDEDTVRPPIGQGGPPTQSAKLWKPPAESPELKAPAVFETFRPNDEAPAPRAPLPIKPRPQQPSAPIPHRPPEQQPPALPQVHGIKCARGHFNNPNVAFCRQCGLRMNQTKIFSIGNRPPLGFLVLDDGTTLILSRDLVIGREPEKSDPVRVGGAMPMRLLDSAGRLSRAHVEIRLVEWDVMVIDLNSTNGTMVRPPGQPQWMRLPPGQPFRLTPGCEVQVGGRTITFDSPDAHI